MGKTVVHQYNGKLLSNKKKQAIKSWENMEET